MISDKDAKLWLAKLDLLGGELVTIGARLKLIAAELESIREKIL